MVFVSVQQPRKRVSAAKRILAERDRSSIAVRRSNVVDDAMCHCTEDKHSWFVFWQRFDEVVGVDKFASDLLDVVRVTEREEEEDKQEEEQEEEEKEEGW